MKTLIPLGVAIFSLLLVVAAAQFRSNGDANLARTSVTLTTDVRPLDDPTNPYLGKYGAWDTWIYKHKVPKYIYSLNFRPQPVSKEELSALRPPPQGWYEMVAYVDQDGWLVPYLVSFEEGLRDHSARLQGERWKAKVLAEGVMDSPLQQQVADRVGRLSAAYQPHVPRWLIAESPDAAIFMPNGDVVTHNKPGSKSQFSLFSPTGDLRATCDSHWFAFYNDPESWPANSVIYTYPGGLVAFESEGKVVASFEYDGSKVPGNATVSRYPPKFGQRLEAKSLLWNFKYQQ